MTIALILWSASGACLGLLLNALVLWLPVRMAEEEAFWLATAREQHPVKVLSSSYWKTLFSFKTEGGLTWLIILATICVTIVLHAHFGSTLKTVSWLVFFSFMITLGAIDLKTKYLPDLLTIPLVWLGLIVQLSDQTRSIGPSLAITGAVAGYGGLWLLAKTYQIIRKRDGIGFGDVKLLAAIGAWLGPAPLPWIMFLASILVVMFHSVQFLFVRKAMRHEEFAFGPWIVVATCVLFYAVFLR